ncbi:MAG: SMP-30/gluconolactonase/LRE family protein [Chloroflexi bacterium]|jgi:gluconolactonase|nr:SMP-30/gluconolactonase/LRE family protein [Chloroflexota bacterium]MBT5627359.1 SMP-30/gluconolactonase/LRE family protein [Chloroflexota bacterium]
MTSEIIFHSGLGDPEGPVLLPDGSWGVVEMTPETGCVSVLSGDGSSKRVIVKTGRPNGMVQDANGTLWVAESMNPPSLLRVGLDGSAEVVLTEGDGHEFLFPNDLVFGPDGAMYMTDSGVHREPFVKAREEGLTDFPIDGKLFRIDLENMSVTMLDDGLQFTNGLAFGIDNALYVTATVTGLVYRYEWNADGTLGPREDFADLVDRSQPPGFKGGDGLAVGENGYLYCAVVGQGDVTVIDTNGGLVERIPVGGEQPTNVAFGPKGSGDIYVTVKDTGTLERHHVGVEGLPLLPSK